MPRVISDGAPKCPTSRVLKSSSWAPGAANTVCAILCAHLESLYAFYGEQQGLRIARKHLGWYAKDRPENGAFRTVANRAESANEQLALTREYFEAQCASAELPIAA